MVTDRYQHVRYHETIEEFVGWAAAQDLPVIGIDNLPGAESLDSAPLPYRCALLFGQEGPGLSAAAREACGRVLYIPQYGSTRSINAGVASGIAMYSWVRQHATPPPSPRKT
jgi:tRNA G18 (ribose-2'-O)-methylase SpoU